MNPKTALSYPAEETPTLENTVSAFALSEIDRLGIRWLADKVVQKTELSLEEARELSSLPLPFLAKLVEIHRAVTPRPQLELYPTLFLPLASLLEKHGTKKAFVSALDELKRLDSNLCSEHHIQLVIDRWWGEFPLDNLLQLIAGLTTSSSNENRYLALGPSTAELKRIAKVESDSPLKALSRDFFSRLRLAGISTIYGGSDIEIHRIASQHDFDICVSFPIQNSPHWLEDLLQHLMAVSEALIPSNQCRLWSPWSSITLDGSKCEPNSPLGIHMLTAIALGRLLLPEIERIGAPISVLGPKTAEIALFFGADDLGHAAVDTNTIRSLNMLEFSQMKDIIGRYISSGEG